MNEKTISIGVRIMLLIFGLLYIASTPYYISVERITYAEGCLVIVIGGGQIWAAYVLKDLGGDI